MSVRTLHKGLSLLLMVVMLLGMMPTGALAADVQEPEYTENAVVCACADCSCADCACAGGECLCESCGDHCACADGECLYVGCGDICSCAQGDPVQTSAPVRGTHPITEGSFGIDNIKWSRGTDDGTKISPERLLTEGKKATVNRAADEEDPAILMEAGDDEHCEGCGKYLPNSAWYCDDCHYCHECILSGEGPYHCADCEGCDVEPCEYCTEHHVNDGGNFVLCKDCACDDGYHCYECDECLGNKDYHDVCGICKECLIGGAEPLHCGGCGSCTADICEECSSVHSLGEFGCCVDCAQEHGWHCEVCGGCYESDHEKCEDADINICVECCMENDMHCNECGNHVTGGWCEASGDYGGHCLECAEAGYYLRCVMCDQVYCDTCGGPEFVRSETICERCIDDEDLCCPECDNIDENLEWCRDGGRHCVDCCETYRCMQCDRCTDAVGIDLCPDCGLCVECCLENAEAEGCSCGDYCVESSDWYDHFCENCGECFDNVDQCDECGLCADCCADNSDCSDGMCVQDSEYEEHFCIDCGECFHDVDPCDDCITAGEQICVECCAQRSAAEGCDHGVCMNSWEWAEHYCQTHGCCYEDCPDDPTVHTHIWGADDNCTICGKNKDGKPVITAQPNDYHLTMFYIDDDRFYDEDADVMSYPWASFYVRASGDHLSYKWYSAGSGKEITTVNSYWVLAGADTSKLGWEIPTDACYTDYGVFCRVSNENGYVDSDVAYIRPEHNYTLYRSNRTGGTNRYNIYNDDGSVNKYYYIASSNGHFLMCCGEGCEEKKYENPEPHIFGGWTVKQEATANHAGLLVRECVKCGAAEGKVLPQIVVHEHVWEIGYSAGNTAVHSQICTVCGFQGEISPHSFGEWVETKAPTEQKTGTRERTCTVCGYTQQGEAPKLAHIHLQYTKNGKVICEEGETWEYTCYVDSSGQPNPNYHFKRCLMEVSDGNGGTKVCGVIEPASRQLHYFQGWTYNESTSSMSRKCAICGYTQTQQLDKGDKYYVLDGDYALYYNAMGSQIYAAKEYELVTVKLNTIKMSENLFDFWLTGGTLDITSQQQRSTTFTFRMPAHRVAFSVIWKDCIDQDVAATDLNNARKHRHMRYVDGVWGTTLTEDSDTYLSPTCTAVGHEAYSVCRECGQLVKYIYDDHVGKTVAVGGEEIPALGHSYELDEATVRAATCTEYGYTGDMVCKRCGDRIKGERTARLGHQYSTDARLVREADCVHGAVYGYYCRNEGCEKYITAYTEPALGHDWGEWQWVKLPTATEDGEMECFCSRCKNGKSKTIPRGTETGIVEEVITDLGTIVVQVPKAGQSIYVTDDSIGDLKSTSYPSPTLPEDCHYTQYRVLREPWENIDDEHINDLKYLAEVDYGTRIAMEPKVLYKFPESALEISVKIVDQDGNEFLRDAPLEKGGVFTVSISSGRVILKLNYMPPHTYRDPYYYLDYDYSDPAQFTVSGARAIFECTSGGANYETAAECVTTPDPEGCLTCSLTVIGPDGKTWTYTQTTEHLVNDAAAVAATCTEDGHEAGYRCSLCGKYFTGYDGVTELTEGPGVIPALGHAWGEWKTVIAATETAEGAEERECSRCHEKETRTVPELGHVHSLTHFDAKAATCEADGYKEYWKCSGCGKLFADAACAEEVAHLSDLAIAPLGHAWGEPEYEWAEDNSSVTARRVCSRDSGHVLQETATTTYTVTLEPTEEKTGLGEYRAEFTEPGFTAQTKQVTIPVPDLTKLPFQVEGKRSGGSLTVTVTSKTEAKVSVVVTLYLSGRLAGVRLRQIQIADGETECTLTGIPAGYTYKVFLLDEKFRPLADAWTEN